MVKGISGITPEKAKALMKHKMSGIQPKVVHKIPGVTGSLSDKKPDKEFKKKLQAHKMVNKKPN